MSVKIEVFRKGSTIGYKAVAENSPLLTSSVSKTSDTGWAGFYLAENIQLTRNYASEKVGDLDGGYCLIQRAVLKEDLKVIVCDDLGFKRGPSYADMAGIKNQIINELRIKIDPDKPFMEELEKFGYCFKCYNNSDTKTENIMEIIIPPAKIQSSVKMQNCARCQVLDGGYKTILNPIKISEDFHLASTGVKNEEKIEMMFTNISPKQVQANKWRYSK